MAQSDFKNAFLLHLAYKLNTKLNYVLRKENTKTDFYLKQEPLSFMKTKNDDFDAICTDMVSYILAYTDLYELFRNRNVFGRMTSKVTILKDLMLIISFLQSSKYYQ